MAAALLEAVTMDLRRAVMELERAGVSVGTLRATGGGARSRRWLQLKADVTGRVVERVAIREAGAFAAALLGGAAIGLLPPARDAALDLVRVDLRRRTAPRLEAHYEERAALHAQLRSALQPFDPTRVTRAASGRILVQVEGTGQRPPSTSRWLPLMKLASSLARNTAARAISAGEAMRRIGVLVLDACSGTGRDPVATRNRPGSAPCPRRRGRWPRSARRASRTRLPWNG